MAVVKSPSLYLRKFAEFMGTGFAQPNPTSAHITNPTGSKCFTGLSVSLPFIFGVRSPFKCAAKACANSCGTSTNTIASTDAA